MEEFIAQLLFGFGCVCGYIGYSKTHYRTVVWGFLSGLAFIVLAAGIAEGIRYIGFGTIGVIPYTPTGNVMRSAAVYLFGLGGLVIMINTLLKFAFGAWDEKSPLEDVMEEYNK